MTLEREAEGKLSKGTLIVGGGHAGAQCAVALRQNGYTAPITIVSDEVQLPYERPPLSKEYLAGEKPFERMLLRPESFWDSKEITIKNGEEIRYVDPSNNIASSSAGVSYQFDTLVWAAGAAPRKLPLPGASSSNVHYIRTKLDIDRIIDALPNTKNIVIIGAGYIGLEAAAVLRKLGKSVTVLEAQSRVLSRVTSPTVSSFVARMHEDNGVEIRTGAFCESLEHKNGQVKAVTLQSSERLPADMLIVGIGVEPVIGPLASLGLKTKNGLDVDAQCRTSYPNIYAIGDCASHVNRYAFDHRIRLESVQNANDQAAVAAKTIAGKEAEYTALPWFWSNQYDTKLQTVGVLQSYNDVIVRGNAESNSFSVVHLQDETVVSIDCINAMADFAQGRKLILSPLSPHQIEMVRDPSVPLKQVLPT